MTFNGFSKQIYFFWPRQTQRRTGRMNSNNRKSFQKSSTPPKKWIGHPIGNWKIMGPQNRKYTEKNSRFRVMGQKEDSKKGLKSWITPEKKFLGTSEWYQSIGLKILHNICLPQKFSLAASSHNHKYTNLVFFAICPGARFTKLKLKLSVQWLYSGLRPSKACRVPNQWNEILMPLRYNTLEVKTLANKWHHQNAFHLCRCKGHRHRQGQRRTA